MGAPDEPWAHTLGTMMLALGIGLVACFILPWRIGDVVDFSWTRIASGAWAGKVAPLLIGATGITSLVLGLISLSVPARGISAAAVGFVAIVAMTFLAQPVGVASVLSLIVALTLTTGLLLRSAYHGALLARILVTVGVLFTFVLALWPSEGGSALSVAFAQLTSGSAGQIVVALFRLAWYLVALFGLLAWLPGPGTVGTKLLAWLLIIWPLMEALLNGFFIAGGTSVGAHLMASIAAVFLIPSAQLAWLALLTYGVATLIGKQLEHG